jgi:hypothetical protein
VGLAVLVFADIDDHFELLGHDEFSLNAGVRCGAAFESVEGVER